MTNIDRRTAASNQRPSSVATVGRDVTTAPVSVLRTTMLAGVRTL
jgi:hypothetical protein